MTTETIIDKKTEPKTIQEAFAIVTDSAQARYHSARLLENTLKLLIAGDFVSEAKVDEARSIIAEATDSIQFPHHITDATVSNLQGTDAEKLAKLQKYAEELEEMGNEQWGVIMGMLHRSNARRTEANRLLKLCLEHYGEDSDVFYQVREYLHKVDKEAR